MSQTMMRGIAVCVGLLEPVCAGPTCSILRHVHVYIIDMSLIASKIRPY
jgi:hypothetical protein